MLVDRGDLLLGFGQLVAQKLELLLFLGQPGRVFVLLREPIPHECSRTQPVEVGETSARSNEPAHAQLCRLIESVCSGHGINPTELGARQRPRRVSRLRAVIAYRAVVELGIPGLEVARALCVSPSATSHAIERGRDLLAEDQSSLS